MDPLALAALTGVAIALIYGIYVSKEGVGQVYGDIKGAVTGKVDETSTTSTPFAGINPAALAGHIIDPPGGGTIKVSTFGKTFPVTYKLAYSGGNEVSGSVDIAVTQISILGNTYKRVTTVPGVTLPGNGSIVQQTINAEVANGFEIDLAYGMTVFIELSFAGYGITANTVHT